MSSPSEDIGKAVSGIVDAATDKAEHVADVVSNTAGDVAEQVKKTVADASARSAEMLDDSTGFLRRQLRDRPWLVVAAAAAVAFALGVSAGQKARD